MLLCYFFLFLIYAFSLFFSYLISFFASIYLNISHPGNCCSKIVSLRIFEVTKVDSLSAKIQNMYGYSDYEMALIKYSVTAMLSEVSKIVILSIFYLSIGKFDLFVAFSILLIFLRINGGGYHCKHYVTCLMLSFFISICATIILPFIFIPNHILMLIFLTICLYITYYVGPIPSPFRPTPSSILIKQCNIRCFLVISLFIIVVSIFNTNTVIKPYLIVGFWTIILHTLQLIIAKILRKGD